MRHTAYLFVAALVAATAVSGCRDDDTNARNDAAVASDAASSGRAADRNLPSGTTIDVALGTALTSETASVGDAWSGSVRSASVVDGWNVIPAGSSVSGTVGAVRPARKGDRAMLDLGLTSVTVGDRTYRVRGTTEAIVAGSTRARNLGAIGAATAAGAVVGQAVGGSTKSTVVGAVVGGGAATAVVSQTKGFQVALKEGTPLTFKTTEAVAVRP